MKIKFIGKRPYRGDGLFLKPGEIDIIELNDAQANRLLEEHPDQFCKIVKPKRKKSQVKKIKSGVKNDTKNI